MRHVSEVMPLVFLVLYWLADLASPLQFAANRLKNSRCIALSVFRRSAAECVISSY